MTTRLYQQRIRIPVTVKIIRAITARVAHYMRWATEVWENDRKYIIELALDFVVASTTLVLLVGYLFTKCSS